MSAGPASVVAAVVVASVVLASSDGAAGRRDYVGTEACGACHSRELAIWRRGPHARASAVLGSKPKTACLRCHTTGDAPTGPVVERRVGCEACHGPGAGYAPDDIMRNPILAQAVGLRRLVESSERRAVCGLCHAGVRTSLKPLDLERAWRRIGHGGGKP